MCGIFGIVRLEAETSWLPDEERLWETTRRLQHRGPDAQKIWRRAGIGLAHTRLSLVDLSERSDQPFWDPSKRYVLVYNGEIYNYQQLGEELTGEGVELVTSSDTEVLLHALIRWDTEHALRRLEGMFGFGFYDTETGRLILARDRFGMKPLYVYESSDTFAFASEVKALSPWLDLSPDEFSIAAYLLGHGGPTKGATFYKGVRSVPPGAMITLERGSSSVERRFFRMTDFLDEGELERQASLSPSQAVDDMERRLLESVNKHLFADAPVGAFASGGVDSSILVAMAAKSRPNIALFHANVKGRFSERHAAEALAKSLGLDLQVVDVEERDIIDLSPEVMRQYEHPFTYHPNCAPMMLVARLVRQSGVKGMLSGEGSDECFLGYPWLGRKKLVDRYLRAARGFRRFVKGLPALGAILVPSDAERPGQVEALLSRREVRDDQADIERVLKARFSDGSLDDGHVVTLDYLNYHLRTLLHRNDCLGMEASVEARFPFLDNALVRAAVNMPTEYKLRRSPIVFEKAHPFIRDKWVIRKVADRYIPKNLSQRIKIGFWTTVFRRTEIDPAYFEGSFVEERFGMGPSKTRVALSELDADLQLRLLHVDLWAEVCLRQTDSAELTERLRRYVDVKTESRWS